jgi:hypothetical protein
MIGTRLAGVTIVIALALGWTGRAAAQGLSVDVGAGRFVYDAVSANVGSNNLVGAIRYDGRRDAWVFGAAGAPLGDGDAVWMAAGTGGRFLLPPGGRRVSTGADVSGHGFSYRDGVAGYLGHGGSIEAIPFVRLTAGAGSVEARGGWRGHTLSFAGNRENRGVVETGARAGYGGAVRLEGEARWVHAGEGVYPFAGASLLYAATRVQLWGQGGRWLSDALDDVSWSAGGGIAIAPRMTIWASVRQEAPDPLYWNPARRTWSVGLTQRFGRVPAPMAPVPRRQDGTVVVRMRVSDAPAGDVSIAGDFNGWQPAPMQREGGEWVIRLPLAPGVYHYAFRSSTGAWFVPSSSPGRRDDGMGGHVAVMVVS